MHSRTDAFFIYVFIKIKISNRYLEKMDQQEEFTLVLIIQDQSLSDNRLFYLPSLEWKNALSGKIIKLHYSRKTIYCSMDASSTRQMLLPFKCNKGWFESLVFYCIRVICPVWPVCCSGKLCTWPKQHIDSVKHHLLYPFCRLE